MARVSIVQAVPGAAVDVRIDDRPVASAAAVGDVLGPFDLAPGAHDISFRGDGFTIDSELEVEAGSSDVVVHLPADVKGDPVVHSYPAPTGAIGPDKARVMLAHTATVAPADVEVDGRTVFTNIANGEFAEADVPAGSIEVALVPSGSAGDPILGPLDLTLEAGTLSMVYAYGNPRDGSMNVIAHTAELAPDGSVRPSRIDTGSGGLVANPVTTFGDDRTDAAARPGDGRAAARGRAGRPRSCTTPAGARQHPAATWMSAVRALVEVTAVMALLAGSGGCTAGEASPTTSPAARASASPPSATSAPRPARGVPPARRATSVPVPQAPATAVLPSGRTVPVRTVGTTPAGLLDVPDDVDAAGWWGGGSRIGDPFGSILVAAHVDSRTQGLGPFAELLTVSRGARIVLASADLRQTFVVRSRKLVPQGSLVDDSWIFDATGDARLTLVTCAPPYVVARGGYQNLAVVTAVPVGPPEDR